MTKINVGCGRSFFGKDWIHVGSSDYDYINHRDITLLSNHPEQSVDLIYSSHLFEYFDREKGKVILSMWFSRLKSGGTIRLAVPDFTEMCYLYSIKKIELKDILGPLYGKMEMNGESIYHKTVYNFKELSDMLREVGFESIKRYDYKDTEHGHIDDCSHAHLPHDPEAIASGIFTGKHTLISLNVEAKKP